MAGRARPYHPVEPDSISGFNRHGLSQRAEVSKTARKQVNGMPMNRNINQTRHPEQAAVKFARKTSNQIERMHISRPSSIPSDRAPSVARKAPSSAFPRPDETPWRMRHQVLRKLPSSPILSADSLIPENQAARKQPTIALERWAIQDEERLARAAVISTHQRRSIITPSRKQTFATPHSVKSRDREVFFLGDGMNILSARNPNQPQLITKAARKNDTIEILSDDDEDETTSPDSDLEISASPPSESGPESDAEPTPASDDDELSLSCSKLSKHSTLRPSECRTPRGCLSCVEVSEEGSGIIVVCADMAYSGRRANRTSPWYTTVLRLRGHAQRT